jgi:hypothetical protein
VHLVVTQQDGFFLAVDDQRNHGRVKGSFFSFSRGRCGHFDRLRGCFATVNDTRHHGSATQAAARTRSLQRTRLRDQFKVMLILQVFPDPRPEREVKKLNR